MAAVKVQVIHDSAIEMGVSMEGIYFGNTNARNYLWIDLGYHWILKSIKWMDKVIYWDGKYQSRYNFGRVSVDQDFWFENVKLSGWAAVQWKC